MNYICFLSICLDCFIVISEVTKLAGSHDAVIFRNICPNVKQERPNGITCSILGRIKEY